MVNVSKNLQTLKQAGLVISQRQGQRVVYALRDPSVFRLIVSLRDVAESQLDSMQSLLDVRPADEFAAGHIPQAINIPIEQLPEKLAQLTAEPTLIVYCRGPYCMWSQQALDQLQQHSIQAKHLAEGYPEWQQLRHAP
jgi:rhodanese-related sulfurtransferase